MYFIAARSCIYFCVRFMHQCAPKRSPHPLDLVEVYASKYEPVAFRCFRDSASLGLLH